MNRSLLIWISFVLILTACRPPEAPPQERKGHSSFLHATQWSDPPLAWVGPLKKNVRMHDYYCFIDSVVHAWDSLVNYPLTEHLLVRANPWIIDTLAGQDYYLWAARDSFVYDQKEMIVLKKGDSLGIPSLRQAAAIIHDLEHTLIDVNIPEFRLRIYQHDTLLYKFPVRVGQYRKRYLALAGHEVDLRTHTGTGKIVRIARDPWFIDPCGGKRFTHTRRDDGRTTWMPMIPWMEPELDGTRWGQLIHPTTNPKTLEKAYSNGCIGTKESDAWIIYYHAPVGTAVKFRYDLNVVDEKGDTLLLKDIYDQPIH
ncbi:MAG: L,D-transpeptidase [Bacteroidia bacterium]|nr:L,D-transpeptidase [Bacteroidia bacterium]